MNLCKRTLTGFAAFLRSFGGRRSDSREHANRETAGAQILVDRVLRSISNNSLVLRDEDPAGAARLLHLLSARIGDLQDPAWAFYPVPVQLRGVPEDGFFDLLADAVFAALAHRLGGLEVEECSRPPGDLGFRRLSCNLRRVVDELQSGSAKKVKLVLLMDGIDQLNHYHPRVNQKLRSLFMTGLGEHLVAVAAGAAIDRRWERDGSPWYNFFEEVEVGSLL